MTRRLKNLKIIAGLAVFLFFQAHSARLWAQSDFSPMVGGIFEYTVQPGDYLIKISARFGVAAQVIARENKLDYDAPLKIGQSLVIDNRHIVPEIRTHGLLVNLPQRMLYFFQDSMVKAAYPVGLGRPNWQTLPGNYHVNSKQIDKPWYVPLSIQDEMREAGLPVKSIVQPGPDNPLGKYWLGLTPSAIGIHGTIAPASVYHFQSHGCIRLHPDDIEVLFQQIALETTCQIIYVPMLLTQVDGRVYLEVNRDIYNKSPVTEAILIKKAEETGLTSRINWERARTVLKKQEGLARDITLTD